MFISMFTAPPSPDKTQPQQAFLHEDKEVWNNVCLTENPREFSFQKMLREVTASRFPHPAKPTNFLHGYGLGLIAANGHRRLGRRRTK